MIHDLKPYPAYKDFGVLWLGDVPEHWEIRRLKQVCRFAYGDSLPTEIRQQGEIAVFGSNGRVGFHSTANTHTPCIVIGRKGSFGKVNFSTDPVFAIDTTFFIDDRFTKANLHWLYYLLGWLRLDEVSKDSAVPGLHREDAYQRIVAYPTDSDEQSAIVHYIDYIDRQIRRYIRAKQKLIKLLEEQKQAIIHQAVTRGLDPDVRLKPSGVEWLGDVPEHWEVLRLKSLVTEAVAGPYGSSLTKEMYTRQGYRVYGQQQVIPDDFTIGDYYISAEQFSQMQRYRVFTGDVLVSVMGTVGRVAVVPENAEPGIINPRLVRYRPDTTRVKSRYLQLAMQGTTSQVQLREAAKGTTMEGLNMQILGKLVLAIPPLNEQDTILNEWHTKSEVLVFTENNVRSEISLLREYRTRLIADVVTGKLDVREAVANLPEEIDETEVLDEGLVEDEETTEEDLDREPEEET
ncbi:restriction endonuclease subunit S [Methanosarcina sp. Z-7115]|uniref:Restriction endonuclease subunit S n=1 Tax=Methanosarcina baikalica TaxID=3073890 RepID=A0ABU2CX66_9EURY|nr:restriction endonuclease subunit S [Methanosarcina sp. Z-7115]MDR7664325.1 restriction endonuclease subunit S [Methanosarcina sp. Z-7115]